MLLSLVCAVLALGVVLLGASHVEMCRRFEQLAQKVRDRQMAHEAARFDIARLSERVVALEARSQSLVIEPEDRWNSRRFRFDDEQLN